MVASGLPSGPLPTDPCAATSEPQGLVNRVCYDGRTIVETDGIVEQVEAGAHAGVTFVTYTVDHATHTTNHAVATRDGTTWTSPMAAGDLLGLRALGATVVPTQTALDGFDPYRLVHLKTPMLPEWKQALHTAGVTIHAYVPVNHFVVRIHGDSDLLSLPFVDAVLDVPTDAKLEPGLADEAGVHKVNILYWPSAPDARENTLAALASLGAEVEVDSPEIERVQAWVDATDLTALAATPDIMWIDRAGDGFETDMDRIRVMTGAEDIQDFGVPFDGTGIVGQVMDSELATGHPDFQASLLVDYSAPQNPNGIHGTMVYGIVFGAGTGNAAATGMAPGAKATFAQYFTNTRYHYAQRMVDDYGGVFQTHSWGHSVPKDNTYDSYSNENDRVVQELDVLMLQSMSNFGPQNARREAMAKNILSIGGLYHYNSVDLTDDQWNNGASTGPAADGRIKPELAGPYDQILTTYPGNGYTGSFGGTSGATPVVAGAVALVNDMAQEGVFPGVGPEVAPATVKALLIASAYTYAPNQVLAAHAAPATWPAEPFKRDIQGWGLPDLKTLYNQASGAVVLDETVGLQSGESHTVTYAIPANASRMHVTLAWTDLPANPGASPTLVNDLDLAVQSNAIPGVLFHGNFGLDQSPVSLPGGSPDNRNNVENVFYAGTPGTELTITVTGAAVNLDADPATPEVDQSFSLVVLPMP